jgi:hypothetical protein
MASQQPLTPSTDYRSRAKECRDLARNDADYDSARDLLRRADTSERLAMLAAQTPKPPNRPEPVTGATNAIRN